jgi:hypothetical protein
MCYLLEALERLLFFLNHFGLLLRHTRNFFFLFFTIIPITTIIYYRLYLLLLCCCSRVEKCLFGTEQPIPPLQHTSGLFLFFFGRWETMISLLSPSIMKKEKNEISPFLFSQLWKWDSFHQKETMTIADYRTDSPPVAVCMLGQTEPFLFKNKSV